MDRFTWERAIRDHGTAMPRDLLCLGLLLATYSTGKTGGDIEVSEAALAAILGYDTRAVRRLIAELRGYGVIERKGGGNRYGPARYVLVLPPADLAARAERARAARAAERSRASKQPKASRPGAVLPVKDALDRAQDGSRPGAGEPYTGRSAPSYQDQDQEGPPATRAGGPSGGTHVNSPVEGRTGPPRPAEPDRAVPAGADGQTPGPASAVLWGGPPASVQPELDRIRARRRQR
jgi:hypothetical protein